MNIQQFQYLLAVVDFKHFEAAADACFVTQSTLSTMIRRFEDEIGIKIFNRKTKPVSITQEGHQIIERLRIIQKELDSLENIVQELKGEMKGELKIGVIPTVASDLLPLFLADFAKCFPKVKIIVHEMTTEAIQKSLKLRYIDVGIAALPLFNNELEEFALYCEPFVVYDWNRSKQTQDVAIKDLDYSKLWLLEEGHCLRTQVQNICELSNREQKNSINIEFKAGSLGSLLSFTKANKGVTILPYLSSLELNENEKTKLLPFASPTPVRSIGLVTHKHFVKKKLLLQLKQSIEDAVKHLIPPQEAVNILPPL